MHSAGGTFVALLRGVNVGGNNKLPMADLRTSLTAIALENVRTYIQSGNVVFSSVLQASELQSQIEGVLSQQFSINTPVMVLQQETFLQIYNDNPFEIPDGIEKALQLYVLSEPATAPQLDKLAELKSPSEEFSLSEQCFYLYAPEGIGRSKLAEKAEKLLGVTTTTRNWRTATKLVALMDTE